MNKDWLEFKRRIYRNNPFIEKLCLKRTWNVFDGYHSTLTFNIYTVYIIYHKRDYRNATFRHNDLCMGQNPTRIVTHLYTSTNTCIIKCIHANAVWKIVCFLTNFFIKGENFECEYKKCTYAVDFILPKCLCTASLLTADTFIPTKYPINTTGMGHHRILIHLDGTPSYCDTFRWDTIVLWYI